MTWWWGKDHRKTNRWGSRGRRKENEFRSAMIWIFISAKENPVVFSESQFSQWQLHSWITKLTIIALSKNKQSTPQYAVNKLWKISKSPGPEGNAAGLQGDMANFYKHLNCDPVRSPSIALFALSVKCHLSLAYWTRGSMPSPLGSYKHCTLKGFTSKATGHIWCMITEKVA